MANSSAPDTKFLRTLAEDCSRKPHERVFGGREAFAEELTPAVVLALLDELEALREGHAAGRAEALEEAERMRTAVIAGLAELARMDRVPCRHYRECNCREVLDREQVMTEVMAIKRAL